MSVEGEVEMTPLTAFGLLGCAVELFLIGRMIICG
jgi:hypothetical protein